MKSQPIFACILLFSTTLFSQTSLSGIINRYTNIIDIDPCTSLLQTGDASGFSVGDQVLLIQMKGATINESDSDSFGNIEEIASAGLFEKNEIEAINGQNITLKYLLLHDYDTDGAVQLVSFPVWAKAVVTGTVVAADWDGEKGGVVAFGAEDSLLLEADIDASSKGFRGAMTNTVASDCTFLTNANDYFYDLSNWRGAPKGEGIADIIPGKEQGRGAQANGGGGGNDHNAGGGGGANLTPAGQGGQTLSPGFNCDGEFPGKGGKVLPNTPERWFLGGGGGAGHDNNGSGSGGGHGGGLVIIQANTIRANGFAITANGQSASQATGDGGGGGGAGGTIVVDAGEITDELTIRAAGGNGGNVQNPSDRCNGPGGGGSGGRFVCNLSNLLDIDLSGGMAGENLTPSGQCSDPSSGAVAGQTGLQTSYSGLPGSTVEPVSFAINDQPQPMQVCENDPAFFAFSVVGNGLIYQWQCDDGNGWQNVASGNNYSGVTSSQLTLLNASPSQNGFLYRCLVSGPCVPDTLSAPAALQVEGEPQAAFVTDQLGNNTYSFVPNTANALAFFWDFGDGTTSNDPGPTHQYLADGQYLVTLTVTNNCGEDTITETIVVGGLPVAAFQAAYNGCAPVEVQFQDSSTGPNILSFQWVFPGGNPAVSDVQNPVVVYEVPGSYDVTLTVTNPNGEHTTTVTDLIEIFPLPEAGFDALVDSNTVYFTNNSTGATNYTWSFGDGATSNEFEPVHTYMQEGVYQVLLSAGNPACGSTVSQELLVAWPNATGEIVRQQVTVFPNPFSGEVKVELDPMPSAVTLTLLDMQGRVLLSEKNNGQVLILKTAGLPTGCYLLRVQAAGFTEMIKLLKIK